MGDLQDSKTGISTPSSLLAGREWTNSPSGSPTGKRQTEGQEEDGHGQDQVEGADAGPKKKQRLPRIAEACIRCKGRKQRCVKDPGAEVCKNCAGVNAECIVAPRARRRNARSNTQPDVVEPPASPRYAAASPVSLQNLLRTDPPPSMSTPAHAPFVIENPSLASSSSAIASTSRSQNYAPTALPTPFQPQQQYYPTQPPSYPSAPTSHPSQYYNTNRYAVPQSTNWTNYQPHPNRHSPLTSSSSTLMAPTSDLRSSAPISNFSETPSLVSQSPTLPDSRSSSTPFAPQPENRSNSHGKGRAENNDYSVTRNGSGHGAVLNQNGGDGDTDLSSERDEEGIQHEAARGVAFLSLNAGGNPIYVGPSSGFSWARMVLGGMAGESKAEGGNYAERRSRLETRGPFETGHRSLSTPPLSDDALSLISEELADHVLTLAYRDIQCQYCFFDWLWFRSIFPHRVKICQAAGLPGASKATRTGAFFIWVVFAIGSRLARQLPSLAPSESYYIKAMEHLEVIVGLHDLKNVEALLMMTMYSFRAAEAPSVWFLSGIIIRLCCSLGLHRRLPPARSRRMSPYVLQLRRRIFWTSYLIDRMLSTSLGRPTSINDEEIDIELPFDYDCCDTTLDPANPPTAITSMTSSIHYIKLMQVTTTIRRRIYRLDHRSSKPPDDLLKEIDEWEANIPPMAADSAYWQFPCCSRDWFLSKAHDTRLYLLRPLTADKATSDPAHLKLIAQYSAEACEIQKRLHQSPLSNLALETLRTVFLNGLTLLHSVRLDKTALSFSAFQRASRACSNTLYAYSQQFSGAAAYFECFDELSSMVSDQLSSAEGSTVSPSSINTPLFPNLWEEIPSMMTAETEDSFAALLDSLGVPAESIDFSLAAHNNALGLANDYTYCEPATGLFPDPFAAGGAGLW